jgi:hypothetical protein
VAPPTTDGKEAGGKRKRDQEAGTMMSRKESCPSVIQAFGGTPDGHRRKKEKSRENLGRKEKEGR